MEVKKIVHILSSAKLHNQDMLDKYSCKIISFLEKCITKEYLIKIGKIKNAKLIYLLQNNGYDVNEVNQHPTSLRNSNQKLIKDSEMVLFLNYPVSPYIDEYIQFAKKIQKKNLYVLNVESMDSATQLFKHRCDSFNHSESKWSAFAQMAFIWMSKQDNKSLNIYKSQYKLNNKSQYKLNRESWLKKESVLNIKNWTVDNSIVEGTISKYFKAKGISDIANLKPDLVLVNEEDKKNIKITIVEVKTVGAGVRNNIKKYRELAQKIDKLKNYSCELYYLMSYGHEDSEKDWRPLEEDDANILLWEEIFLELQKANSPILDYITPLRDISNWQEYIDIFDYTKLS